MGTRCVLVGRVAAEYIEDKNEKGENRKSSDALYNFVLF